MNDDILNELRGQIADIDAEIFRLAAQRNRVVEQVSQRKRALNLPQRNFAQEKLILERAQKLAEAEGLDKSIYTPIALTLIRAAITIEEHHIISQVSHGDHRPVLVIGGRGKMGGWMLDFLRVQGFEVVSADPAGPVDNVESYDDWRPLNLDRFDAIVVAPPLRATNQTLLELAARKPKGIVFDVGSLKTPLRDGIQALQNAGVRVTSIHPMFGPDVELLSGQHIIFIDCQDADALAYAHALFAQTTAVRVDMNLDEHDQLIAVVLGLSHAVNIAFFDALAQSGQSAPKLAKMSSTTFDAQLRVANAVAHENPWLYYDIQALNDFGMTSLNALKTSVDRIRTAIENKDPDAFVSIMTEGRDYLRGRVPTEDVLKSS